MRQLMRVDVVIAPVLAHNRGLMCDLRVALGGILPGGCYSGWLQGGVES